MFGKIQEGVTPSAKIIAVVGSKPLGKTPSAHSISQKSDLVNTFYLIEAANGMLVRVPESRLESWDKAQRGD